MTFADYRVKLTLSVALKGSAEVLIINETTTKVVKNIPNELKWSG
jgi:hypothetical protein